MEIMRPGLGPILPWMGGCVSADEVLRPIGRRTIGVVRLKCLSISNGVIPENGAAFAQASTVADEHVPKIVPDLVTKMPKERAIRLTHVGTPPLSLDIVGLFQRNSD